MIIANVIRTNNCYYYSIMIFQIATPIIWIDFSYHSMSNELDLAVI